MDHNPSIPRLTNEVNWAPPPRRPDRGPKRWLPPSRRDLLGAPPAVMAAALALWLAWPLADAQQGLWRTLTMWTVGGVAGAAAVEVHALISPRPPTEPLPRTERVELRDVIVFQTLVITGAAAFAFSSAPELGAAMWLYGAGCLALAAWRLRRGWAATRKQRTSQPR